jgi:exonuclease III
MKLRLISWNCQGAFRKKTDFILDYKPDILVVQECESPDKISFKSADDQPNNVIWIGNSQHKGLGVFSFGDYSTNLIEHQEKDFKTVIPINVRNGALDFNLFAVWANNPQDKDNKYIEQVWKAIHFFENHLDQGRSVLIGDFNSNKIWDRKHRNGNHSDVVDYLETKKIISLYHKYYKQEQGKEEHATFYMQRNKNKPYHIDYCIASTDIGDSLKSHEIGNYNEWIKYSDHMPIIIDFEFDGN